MIKEFYGECCWKASEGVWGVMARQGWWNLLPIYEWLREQSEKHGC